MSQVILFLCCAALALLAVAPWAAWIWGERGFARCLLWALICAASGAVIGLAQNLETVNRGFELRMRLRNPQASAVTAGVIRRNPQKSAEYCLRPGKCWEFSAGSIRRVRYCGGLGTHLQRPLGPLLLTPLKGVRNRAQGQA